MAFYHSGLTSVTIPNSVTSIGRYAFYDCSGLTSVTIGDGVKNIGECAFGSCKALTSVTIPNGVIGREAFSSCGLTSVAIGNGVTSIGEYAFVNCSSLASVSIGNFVKNIENAAFHLCENLTSINVPNSVTSMGNGVFAGCNCLQYTKYDNDCYLGNDDNPYLCLMKVKSTDITSYVINNDCKIIYSDALEGCSKLSSITVSNGVTFIGNSEFSACNKLTEINVENNNTTYTSENGILFNKDKTTIVCYPRGKTETAYTIPNSVTSIGNEAFYCCNNLTSVTIPNSVTSIGSSAFYKCSGLTSVTIPNSVTSIDSDAFACCSGLTTICYEGSSEPTNQFNSFASVNKTIPVCVPADYSSDSWCGFSNLVKGHDKVTDNAVAATCTASGLTEGFHCSKCGKVFVAQEEVAALGHTADSIEFENTISATCTTTGSYDSVVYCSVCQLELFREEKEIPATGHTEVIDAAAPATCTVAGKTDGKHCSVCDAVLVAQEDVAAFGHTEVIDAAIAATCTAAGKTEGKHCSVCKAVLVAQEEVAALGHEFKTYVYNNDATTVADGTETAVCERGCGETDTRTAAGTKLTETSEKGTVVAESAANAINIYAHHNIIMVENAQDEIMVYDAMGKLICRDAINRARTRITIDCPGVYIVKTGNVVKRVMVN